MQKQVPGSAGDPSAGGRFIMKRNKVSHAALTLLLVTAGNTLYAAAVKLFLLPAGLLTGGTTGISLAVRHFTGFDLSGFILVFNVLMLVLGWFLIGRSFAMTTIVSTFVYPLSLKLLDRTLGNIILTRDILLCTVFSGLGIGLALGIVIRSGASTGGMDIPPLILNKYFHIPVALSLYIFDFIILLLQAAYSPTEKILYGLLLVLIYTVVLNKVLTVLPDTHHMLHQKTDHRDARPAAGAQ